MFRRLTGCPPAELLVKINDSVYTFTKIDEATTNIKLWAKLSPTIQAPKWLIKTQFPKMPEGVMERMTALVEQL